MKVELKRPWKNHPAGTVLDVSDGVHDDLVRAGALEKPFPKAETLTPPKLAVKAFRRPPRNKMIESSVVDK